MSPLTSPTSAFHLTATELYSLTNEAVRPNYAEQSLMIIIGFKTVTPIPFYPCMSNESWY